MPTRYWLIDAPNWLILVIQTRTQRRPCFELRIFTFTAKSLIRYISLHWQTCLHIIATRSRSSGAVLSPLTQEFTAQRGIDQASATTITSVRRAAELGAKGTRNELAGGGIIWESAAKNSASLAGMLQNSIMALIYRN